MRRRVLLGTLVLIGATPPNARAQLAPVGVPRGIVRLELRGDFANYDRRYLGGSTQDYGADFSSPSLGSDRIASLSMADATIGQIIGQSGYHLSLGRSTAHAAVNLATGTIGLGLGVTRTFSLFADIPIVQSRVQVHFALDTTAGDAGFNPNDPAFGNGQGGTQVFFDNFDLALATLNTKINNGDYDANPAQKAVAVATLASGTTLRNQLDALIRDPGSASPFLPTDSSAAGRAITTRVQQLQDTLGTLSVGFAGDPVLASSRLDPAAFQDFLSSPAGPVAAVPLRETSLTRLGDIRLGAVYTLVDRWDRDGRPGGFRSAVEAVVTLPTGLPDQSNNFFDVGTGQGRNDVRLGTITDLGSPRWGVRLTGQYLRTFPVTRLRRVSPPSQPIALRSQVRSVRIDAGDELTLEARPFYRLASTLGLYAQVQYWRRGRDDVSYRSAADSLPGIPASVLAEDTRASAWIFGGGLSYASRGVRSCDGTRCPLPIEAGLSFAEVAAASGGRVNKVLVSRVEIRFYRRMWK